MHNRPLSWKYIIGEIVIVSIGILLAFFVNNWSSNLQRAETQQEYENSLIVDLEQNIDKLNAIIKAQEEKVASLNYVVKSLEASSNQLDSIGKILFRERKSPTFFPIKGTFKALVSHGEINLFSTQLKREIFNLFDTNYERTVYNGALYDEIYVDVYDQEIQEVVDFRTMKIRDEATLRSEDFIKNLLIIIDEAESYLALISNTKAESIKVLQLVQSNR